MRHSLIAAALLATSAAPAIAANAPAPLPKGAIEREFEFRLTIEGRQNWKNGAQATEATTKQEYVVRIALRSDDFLYSDNLLDADQAQGLEIKPQYYARKGLTALKALNGGKLPESAEALADRYQKAGLFCFDSYVCNNRAIERLAALNALNSNTEEELEEFLKAPGIADVPRYLYFFGYANRRVSIQVKHDVQVKATRAFDRDQKKLEPYGLSRTADTAGSDEPQRPGPADRRGTAATAVRGAELDQRKAARHPADSLKETLSLPLNAPLDGDYTVQGSFSGSAKVSFAWSFKPDATLPAAVQGARKPVTC